VRLLGLDISQSPQVDFTFAVFPGPEVFAGTLRTGARRTRTEVFEREAGWERGQPLDLAAIERSQAGVGALPFVADMDTARLIAITGDTADLYLPVNEAAGLRVGGVVGYVPRLGAAPGYWGGELDLELSSPFGGGRSVHLNAARQDPDSRRTAISYWEPWPWQAPIWLGFTLRQDDFSTDFIETEATARVRLASHTPRWEAFATWSRIAVEEMPSLSTFAARRYGVGLAVSSSGADAGYRFGLRWNHQRLFPRPDLDALQASVDVSQADFEAFRWLGPRRGFFLKSLATGAGTLVGSGFVPPNLLFRVGGVHSLRGYREEEFLVRDYLRLVLEGHVGNRSQSLFFFVEGAWLNFVDGRNRTVGAAGIGLRVAHRFLLQFGLPSQGGFEAAKIHLGFTTGR
jgi:outer membrane protein assembly factor BamA